MPLDATHANGYLQLDTHSYYGTQMVKTTHDWFTANQKRTFIIERSSLAGMGKFASRWLGDNFSRENNMAYSVSGIMLHNMFGITLAGSDICGFLEDTWLELCTKWHIVGAFYPFSRNHNNWGQKS
jgi:alpha-glucosidase (family GH31 glycosyl hydrolase)